MPIGEIGNFGHFVVSDNSHIELTKYIITGKHIETFCQFKIEQSFVNASNSSTEVAYTFPNDNKFCIYDSTFIIDGRTIKPKIREKEEAKAEYQEAKENGISAMYAEISGNGLSTFRLGNLPPNKEVCAEFIVSFPCQLLEKGTFLKFPLGAKDQSGEVSSKGLFNVKQFFFRLDIEVFQSIISEVNTNVYSTINLIKNVDDEMKKCTVIIDQIPEEEAAACLRAILEKHGKTMTKKELKKIFRDEMGYQKMGASVDNLFNAAAKHDGIKRTGNGRFTV